MKKILAVVMLVGAIGGLAGCCNTGCNPCQQPNPCQQECNPCQQPNPCQNPCQTPCAAPCAAPVAAPCSPCAK